MRKMLQSLLWIIPFLSFLMGYQFLRYLSHTDAVIVPSVVGLNMHEAIKLLSSERLNVRILAEKTDLDVEEGMIISQSPLNGQIVKPHQSIFLVITRRPPKPRAPALFGLPHQEAEQKAKDSRLQLRTHTIESPYPQGTIIAQDAMPLAEIEDANMTVVVSAGITPIRIFPELKGRTVEEVMHFFKPYDIKIEVAHPQKEEGHMCSSCIIVDQRPFAGTLVDLKKIPAIKITAT